MAAELEHDRADLGLTPPQPHDLQLARPVGERQHTVAAAGRHSRSGKAARFKEELRQ